MLVKMLDILDDAREKHYAIAAPNVCNEVTARAAIEAAQENRAPIIIDLIYKVHPDIPLLAKIIVDMAEKATVPVALNLDYCLSYEDAMQALQAGFTSVSLDRTDKPFRENIKETIELTEIAHALNATVEGQLGRVVAVRDYESIGQYHLTDPKQVQEYIDKTNVDALAISIGNARGKYEKEPVLDFDRLVEINKLSKVPLCMHGGSYTGEENLKKCVEYGVTKINVSTELYSAGNEEIFKNAGYLARPYDVFKYYADGYKNKLAQYMKLFDQCGKAG